MPYTVEDYQRVLKEEVLASMTLDELLERVLKGLPPEEFLKRLTREEIEAYLKKLSKSN